MNASTPALDVLTAPLAQIDRRTLSQAWYSALHLARDAATPMRLARARAVHDDAPMPRPTMPTSAYPGGVPAAVASTAAGTDREEYRTLGFGDERRKPATALARSIEREVRRAPALPRRATLRLEGGRGRVELLLRSHGRNLHVIAICSPSTRARVARALAQARYCLARHDIALDARMLENVR